MSISIQRVSAMHAALIRLDACCSMAARAAGPFQITWLAKGCPRLRDDFPGALAATRDVDGPDHSLCLAHVHQDHDIPDLERSWVVVVQDGPVVHRLLAHVLRHIIAGRWLYGCRPRCRATTLIEH